MTPVRLSSCTSYTGLYKAVTPVRLSSCTSPIVQTATAPARDSATWVRDRRQSALAPLLGVVAQRSVRRIHHLYELHKPVLAGTMSEVRLCSRSMVPSMCTDLPVSSSVRRYCLHRQYTDEGCAGNPSILWTIRGQSVAIGS